MPQFTDAETAGSNFDTRMKRARSMVRILRFTAALLLLIHGSTRLLTGGVPGFGEFLHSQGLPFGFAAACLLTTVEIAGTLLLMTGLAVVPISLWLAAEILAGIVMVHARNGWFVVGGGSNGVEYSVLLLAVFIVIAGTNNLFRGRPRKPVIQP